MKQAVWNAATAETNNNNIGGCGRYFAMTMHERRSDWEMTRAFARWSIKLWTLFSIKKKTPKLNGSTMIDLKRTEDSL